MKSATHSTNMTESGEARKSPCAEPVEKEMKIERKPAKLAMCSTVSMGLVRERIVQAWKRGLLSRDLSNIYRGVPRAEIERIVHEELCGFKKEGAA